MKANCLLEFADRFNREELKKYKYDLEPLYDLSLVYGKKLAKKYGADENIVLVSLALMDAKLPEAVRLGSPKEHVAMSLEAAKNILSNVEDLKQEDKENILKCIEEHHGCNSFFSLESEIVTNADCYKFLSLKGILMYASILGRRLNNFEKEWQQLEQKMNEKIKNVTLKEVKEELEPNYNAFKNYLTECLKRE